MKANTPSSNLSKAIDLANKGDYQEAINYYSEVITSDKGNHFLALLYRGDCWRELKQSRKALLDWEEAAKDNPISDLPYLRIGHICFWDLQDNQAAVKNFQIALKKEKGNPEAWNGLGMCDFSAKNYKSAVENYSRAINASKDRINRERRATFYANRAEAYMLLQDKDSALNDCKQALELLPGDDFTQGILEKLTE